MRETKIERKGRIRDGRRWRERLMFFLAPEIYVLRNKGTVEEVHFCPFWNNFSKCTSDVQKKFYLGTNKYLFMRKKGTNGLCIAG